MFGTIHADGEVMKKKKTITLEVKIVCISRGTGYICWDFCAGNVPFLVLKGDYMDIYLLTI